MADLVVSEGYAAAGYEYINVDDCWLEKSRGPRGELIADRERFPSGMKALSTYVSFILSIECSFRLTPCLTCAGSCSWSEIWNLRRLW